MLNETAYVKKYLEPVMHGIFFAFTLLCHESNLCQKYTVVVCLRLYFSFFACMCMVRWWQSFKQL